MFLLARFRGCCYSQQNTIRFRGDSGASSLQTLQRAVPKAVGIALPSAIMPAGAGLLALAVEEGLWDSLDTTVGAFCAARLLSLLEADAAHHTHLTTRGGQ